MKPNEINNAINRSDSNLLTESEKNKSALNAIKEALLPLISSADTEKMIESLKEDSRLMLEKKDQEINSLTESLRIQTEELQSLSEQVEKITEDYEVKINEEREKRLLVEDKLIIQETKIYAYDRIRENFRLRNYSVQLLECKSVGEVDRLVETITALYNNGDEKKEAKAGVGLSVTESVVEYLKANGKRVESNDSEDMEFELDDISPEKLEEARLAGIKNI